MNKCDCYLSTNDHKRRVNINKIGSQKKTVAGKVPEIITCFFFFYRKQQNLERTQIVLVLNFFLVFTRFGQLNLDISL